MVAERRERFRGGDTWAEEALLSYSEELRRLEKSGHGVEVCMGISSM